MQLGVSSYLFSSGSCFVTVHVSAPPRISGDNTFQVVEDFDKFRGYTFFASLQASDIIPEERLKHACKHMLRRLNGLAQRQEYFSLRDTAKLAQHSAILERIEDTKSRRPSTAGNEAQANKDGNLQQ